MPTYAIRFDEIVASEQRHASLVSVFAYLVKSGLGVRHGLALDCFVLTDRAGEYFKRGTREAPANTLGDFWNI